jgi:hypothetical protein
MKILVNLAVVAVGVAGTTVEIVIYLRARKKPD